MKIPEEKTGFPEKTLPEKTPECRCAEIDRKRAERLARKSEAKLAAEKARLDAVAAWEAEGKRLRAELDAADEAFHAARTALYCHPFNRPRV